jgi:tetratricopeptide (TPR) repeat protein
MMSSASDHQERLAAGIRLMDAGRIREAEEVFRYILHQSPSDADAICGLAGTALARRAPQEAFDLLAKARPAHPKHAGLLAALSLAHSALGRFDEALICIDTAIRLAPDDPGHRLSHVQLLLALNRPGDALAAIAAVEESLGDAGRTPDLLNAKGMLLMQTGRSHAGIAAFRAAFSADPGRVEFAHNLALALHGLGYAEDALRFAERAYLNDPGDVAYRLSFARCLISLGRLQDAKDMLQTALALAPQDVAAMGLLAGLLISTGEADTALAMCATLVRQKGQSPDSCLMLAQNLRLAGRFEQALAVLPHAIDASETKDAAARLQAEIHLCLGRPVDTEPVSADSQGKTFTVGGTGLAESIFCARWLTSDMMLHAPDELARLFAACSGAAVTPEAPEEAAPVLALLAMKKQAPDPEAFAPYLTLPDAIVQPWRDALDKLPGPRIGLIWDHAAPGLSLASLWPALEGAGTLISLAADPLRHDLRDFPQIRDGGVNIADVYQLAAAIAALDIIVTPDSIVAHLAGAMGKPGIVLVPAGYPWYWRAENGRAVWYPSFDVLTQTRAGDWQASIAALQTRLPILTAALRSRIEAPSSHSLVDELLS